MKNYFKKDITKKEASDSGMALVLIMLLLGFFTDNVSYYLLAIPLLLINMAYPWFYKYFAMLWLGLSGILGRMMSMVILSLVFFLLVIPVGAVRRLIGKDSLLLRKFKKSKDSVMVTRDHQFVRDDLIHPY